MIGKTYYNIIKRKKLKKMTLSSILTKLKHCDDLSLQEDADPSISKITSESFYVEPVYEEIHRCTTQNLFYSLHLGLLVKQHFRSISPLPIMDCTGIFQRLG